MADRAIDAHLSLTVTAHTGTHRQVLVLFHLLHGLYGTVTGLTGESILNVGPVLKENKVWHPGDLGPGDRFLPVPEAFKFLHFRFSRRRDLVAAHAAAYRGYSSHRGSASERMTILTGDLEFTCVDLMTERDRLLRGIRAAVCGK